MSNMSRLNKTFSSSLKLKILEYINTPLSLGIALRKKYDTGELPDVIPSDYCTAYTYQQDAQALALFSKSDDFSEKDLRADALAAWYASEEQCRETNKRFLLNLFKEKETRSVLFTAARYVQKVLGPYSFTPVDSILSPGSTELLSGLDANLISKFRSKPECTVHAYEKVNAVLRDHYLHYAISCGLYNRDKGDLRRTDSSLPIVKGDSLLFINKSWKALRGISPQPLGNLILQRCDAYSIKKALRKHGLDIDTAPLLHEELALMSSVDDTYSTIDLAAASDTISYQLVKALMPADWFDALCVSRTRFTAVSGCEGVNYHQLEKFSAMGNGYTFELETLLFYALCKAVIQLYGDKYNQASVFGDDIIISRSLAPILIRVLSDVGFKTNSTKTFITGPFKESCGKDFYNGFPVRPVYFKEQPKNETSRAIYLSNRIFLLSRFNDPNGIVYDHRIENLRSRITKAMQYREHVVYGPHSLGDCCFHSENYKIHYKNGIGSVVVLVKKSRHFRRYSNMHHQLVCLLYGIPSTGVIPRGSRFTYVKRSVVIV